MCRKRNKGYCSTSPGCTVLRKIPAEDVLQVTAGHNYVAFLLKDHRVARLRYEIDANTIESAAPTDKNESGQRKPRTNNDNHQQLLNPYPVLVQPQQIIILILLEKKVHGI
ncbi:unnamed protein product [Meloidogyne enterolobii]|uniref:Uncharacterized protein n=3 Tax=Meloidogyne enterolobii TaxID=390850 RepID=A0ACB0YG21_MELEN|nr:unnamed protein product [Meloidogyne enterolobii]